MTYSDKLKDPRWQKKRLQILERDEWSCQWCGNKEATLHVHHQYYEKGAEPWEADEFALTTLCADCHDVHHLMKTPLEKFFFESLRSRIITEKAEGIDMDMLKRVIRSVIKGDLGY